MYKPSKAAAVQRRRRCGSMTRRGSCHVSRENIPLRRWPSSATHRYCGVGRRRERFGASHTRHKRVSWTICSKVEFTGATARCQFSRAPPSPPAMLQHQPVPMHRQPTERSRLALAGRRSPTHDCDYRGRYIEVQHAPGGRLHPPSATISSLIVARCPSCPPTPGFASTSGGCRVGPAGLLSSVRVVRDRPPEGSPCVFFGRSRGRTGARAVARPLRSVPAPRLPQTPSSVSPASVACRWSGLIPSAQDRLPLGPPPSLSTAEDGSERPCCSRTNKTTPADYAVESRTAPLVHHRV